MTVTERIKEECSKNGLSPSAMEKKAGIANGSIGKWEKSNPSVENLSKIANILNVSIDYLYTGNKHEFYSKEEQEWVALYRELSKSAKEYKQECIGFVKGYIARGNSQAKE